jgi:hypothetical protein
VWRQIDVDSRLIDEQGISVLEDIGGIVRGLIVDVQDRDLDMLAIELDHPSIIDGLEAFTPAVALFVRGLLGPGALPGQPDGSAADIDEWVAYVSGKRLFIFTLCPFYGESHPRRSTTGSAFIVIQFLDSFRKINMHRMSLAEKKQLSDKVRAIFTNAGVDYFAYITQGPAEALKMVKPLRQGDQPVRWWKALYDAGAGR